MKRGNFSKAIHISLKWSCCNTLSTLLLPLLEGGVYLDEDILPLVPLDELYSPCSDATIGHDFPIAGVPGKQMKVLAATKDYNIEAPIFSCALDEIIDRIKNQYEPQNNLELTGPLLLNKCYEMHNEGVAVSYIDTTQAKWPYAGK